MITMFSLKISYNTEIYNKECIAYIYKYINIILIVCMIPFMIISLSGVVQSSLHRLSI